MALDTQPSQDQAAQARKYLFDLAFDKEMPLGAGGRPRPKLTFTEEQLESAKKDAYAQGIAAGRAAAEEERKQHVSLLLGQMDQRLQRLLLSQTEAWQEQLTQMQQIALVIARKILPRYVAEHGLGEMEAIVAKVMAEMSREPRLVFRVNEQQFDEAKALIEATAQQAAYAGKLVFLGEPDLGLSECRVEWADGGIERDLKVLWQGIERVMGEVQTLESLEPQAGADAAAPNTATPSTATDQTGDKA